MEAIICIYPKKNNTFLSLTDKEGNMLVWWSAGCSGFRNARKSTPYAAQCVAKDFENKIQKYKIEGIHIKVSGLGPGREAVIRTLLQANYQILTFVDATPLVYNGCRPPKIRKL